MCLDKLLNHKRAVPRRSSSSVGPIEAGDYIQRVCGIS